MHIDVPVWKQKMRKRRSPAVACSSWVSRYVAAAMVLVPSHAGAQAIKSGAWDVTSTVVELSIPGVPGFIQRMIKGKAKAEHKQLSEGQGVDALLAPDPMAKCRVDDQRIADGKYTQSLSCPQKQGSSLQISRAGTYDANGFTGRAMVGGTTTRGTLRIVLDQHARRVAG